MDAKFSKMVYRAGIIGCGNIGSNLDCDPLRKEIWTHAGAYSKTKKVKLVSAADIEEKKLKIFSQRWKVNRVYVDYKKMFKNECLDIVSICTPTSLHRKMTIDAADSGVKAIFCEKPIARSLEEADEMIKVCKRNRVVLAINQMRRWDPLYLKVKKLLIKDEIGKLQTIVGYVDTALFMNSIHLLDMILYFAGNIDWMIGFLQKDFIRIVDGKPDPGGLSYVRFKNGTHGFIKATGKSWEYHMFEIDLQGDQGRIRLYNDGHKAELYKFKKSKHFSGYKELSRSKFPLIDNKERIVNAVKDIIRAIETGREPACSGADGRAALEFAFGFHLSERAGNKKIKFPISEESVEKIQTL